MISRQVIHIACDSVCQPSLRLMPRQLCILLIQRLFQQGCFSEWNCIASKPKRAQENFGIFIEFIFWCICLFVCSSMQKTMFSLDSFTFMFSPTCRAKKFLVNLPTARAVSLWSSLQTESPRNTCCHSGFILKQLSQNYRIACLKMKLSKM